MASAPRLLLAGTLLGVSIVLGCGRKEPTPASAGAASTQSAASPGSSRRVGSGHVGSGHVGSGVCRECHEELHTTYHETVAMARSFYPMRLAEIVEDWSDDNTLVHERSGFHYRMERRGERFFQVRWTLDPEGKPAHEFEREITHVMGSGNHVRTYIHYRPGEKATQLPVSWYAENGGTWAMSPGYDEAGHADFRRAIDHGCMFCHNAYPEVPDVDVTGAAYRGELPRGIDCERCHGAGGRHVALARDDATTYEQVVEAIVNPANLAPDRAMAVCLQCHLETTVQPGLPHSLRRFDREIFSFEPGEALEDFLLPFDAPKDGEQAEPREDRFEIAHHGYRLMQSRCFVESDGELGCVTCHDPHHTPGPEDRAAHFRDACTTCHAADDCGVEHGEPEAMGVAQDDCVACHMLRRRTVDVVHAVMRDHRIVRRPPAGDLLAPLRERWQKYEGDLAFFLPQTAPQDAEAELYLGTAYLEGSVHVDRGIALVERALANGAPAAATPYRMLGLAKSRKQDWAGALAAFEQALALAGDDPSLQSQVGAMLMLTGRLDEAERRFRQALAQVPEHADSLVGMFRIARARSEDAAARSFLERAVRAEPENNQARGALAQLLLAAGDHEGARRQLEQLLRVDPRDAETLAQLALLDRAEGDWRGALLHAREALQRDSGHRRAALIAAMVYATAPDPELRDAELALAHAQDALRGMVVPPPSALLIAAAAHAEGGAFDEAVRLTERALAAARAGDDAASVQQAGERLSAYRDGRAWHAPR